MPTVNWTEQETITFLLAQQPPRDGVRRVSCLNAALHDARRVTGRNTVTGVPESHHDDLAGCWLGATGYLILLDMVGTVFRPVGAEALSGHSIGRALRRFYPTLKEEEREAIYALRCSLVHDFSLVNDAHYVKDERLKRLRRHHFYLEDLAVPEFLVEFPENAWNGEMTKMSRRNATRINIRSLGDVVESVVDHLHRLHSEQRLAITLEGGTVEAQNRYCMTVYPDGDPIQRATR